MPIHPQEYYQKLVRTAEELASKVRGLSGERERSYIAGHAIIQMVLMGVVFFQANLLSCRHSQRADLTRDHRFTLSSTTTNYLGGLGKDVRIVTALIRGSEFFNDVRGVAKEYERFGNGHILVETLDLARDRDRLALLTNQRGVRFDREMIVVMTPDRLRAIPAEDLVKRDPQDNRITEFRGEEVLTAAVLEVSESQQRSLYLLAGKRRFEDVAAIADTIGKMASSQNARIEAISLEGRDRMPEDADALIIPGITEDLTKREMDIVREAWQDRGMGLVLILDTATDTPNLGAFLRAQGINPRKDRVLSTTTLPGSPPRVTYTVPAVFIPGSPITRDLVGMTTGLNGQSRSLEVFAEDPLLLSENIHPQPLLYADGRFWGETDFLQEPFVYDSKQDHGAPISLAASVERGRIDDPKLEHKTSRLVVVANPDIIDPKGNTAKVNSDFLMASLNWTINRASLSGISPRRPSAFTLEISGAQSGLLQGLALFILPGLAFLAAFVVWLRRRA